MEILELYQLSTKNQEKENLREVLLSKCPSAAVSFIESHVDLDDEETFIVETNSAINLRYIKSKTNEIGDEVQSIVNVKRINDAKYINKLFEATNLKLNYGGIFVGCAETTFTRRQRIMRKFFFPLNFIYYYLDFIFKRIFPKIPVLKKIYFFITNGRNRVLSEMEIYGRLSSCGFDLITSRRIKNLIYFVAEKHREPAYNTEASYGPLIKLKRIGKDGKLIKVYKLRTMFAYSEYLQEMIFKQNALAEGGKFKDDPRISTIGKVFRKFWLDELPMTYNMIRGDLKIVGVRPLSSHYFNLYPESLQKLRTRTKPGLIPPFYADMPKTLQEIIASEEKYLNEYLKNPIRTDIKYFYKALYNIIIKKARSK